MTLTLNTPIQSFHITLWLMKLYHQAKFCLQKDQQFRRCSGNSGNLVIIMNLDCDLQDSNLGGGGGGGGGHGS